MPDIVATATDGWTRGGPVGPDWEDASNHAGTSIDSNNTRDSEGVAALYFSMRGTYIVRRSYFMFNTTGISVAPASATLKIYGYGFGEGNLIVVKSAHDNASLHSSDFRDGLSDVTGGSGGAIDTALTASDGSNGGTFASITGFKYTDSPTSSWSTSGYNNMTLNADALADMASLNYFKICLMNYDYDFLDAEVTSPPAFVRNGLWWSDGGGSEVPTLSYSVTAITADNATFFGTNF